MTVKKQVYGAVFDVSKTAHTRFQGRLMCHHLCCLPAYTSKRENCDSPQSQKLGGFRRSTIKTTTKKMSYLSWIHFISIQYISNYFGNNTSLLFSMKQWKSTVGIITAIDVVIGLNPLFVFVVGYDSDPRLATSTSPALVFQSTRMNPKNNPGGPKISANADIVYKPLQMFVFTRNMYLHI